MKQMQGIGQLLWKLREKEGIRQKQLCMGISSLSKYARIEADQQEIDFFLIDRIMGRLGKSVERLTYILPMDVYKIYELRQEVQQKICQRKWEEAEQYLDEYEKNKRAKEDDNEFLFFALCNEGRTFAAVYSTDYLKQL